jgi:hypothetical protein
MNSNFAEYRGNSYLTRALIASIERRRLGYQKYDPLVFGIDAHHFLSG